MSLGLHLSGGGFFINIQSSKYPSKLNQFVLLLTQKCYFLSQELNTIVVTNKDAT
jgi:hypothetical protein